MPDCKDGNTSLLTELQHRQVFKAAGLYVGGAWLATEILLTFIEHSVLSGPTQQTLKSLVIVIFVGGFPPAMLLAWFLDWYKGGIRRERRWRTGSRNALIVAVALLAVSTGVLFAGLLWVVNPGQLIHEEPLYVTVLPCRFRGNPEDAWQGDAVAREISDRMSQLSLLRVPAWTSVKVISNRDPGPAEVALQLQVERLVDCSVTIESNRFSLNLQMYDPSQDEDEWSKRFEGELSDVLPLIGRATELLVPELAPGISKKELRQVNRIPTGNSLAWMEFAQGLQAMASANVPDHINALAHFTSAAEYDPEFVRPLAWIARLHWETSRTLTPGENASDEEIRAHLEAAGAFTQRALNLDSLSAEALSMQRVLAVERISIQNGKLPDQHELHRKIMSLRPSFAEELMWWSEWLESQGNDAEAADIRAQNRKLDPLGSLQE